MQIIVILTFTLLTPLFCAFFLLFMPARNEKLLKVVAFNSACFSFMGSLFLWWEFQPVRFIAEVWWLSHHIISINFILLLNETSFFFLLLTTLLVPLCLLAYWGDVGSSLKEFLIVFLMLDFFLIGAILITI
jgi:NADH-quinone oxidoreductase subunit M